jgi:protein disulfide-isomerase A6
VRIRSPRAKLEMVHPKALTAAAVLLLALPAAADIYSKSSPVLQVDARSYDRLIAKSNYTSVSSCVVLNF